MSLLSDIQDKQVACFKLIQDKNYPALVEELESYSQLLEALLSDPSGTDKDTIKTILERHNELVSSSEATKEEVGSKLSDLHKTAKALQGYHGKKQGSVSITGTKKG